MQGLADGYFVLPNTINHYLATQKPGSCPKTDREEFAAAEKNVRDINARLLSIKGKRTVQSFAKELGKIMWEGCGMGRTKESLTRALDLIPKLREEFWKNVNVPGSGDDLNQSLERANRVADFFELGELMCRDALTREESCGGHFREEHQYPDGEAKRDDVNFAFVSVWEYKGEGQAPELHKEPLVYEEAKMVTRSYK
jgi:succinate dehydrogenase / fumarate reductase flavoprotein subunit